MRIDKILNKIETDFQGQGIDDDGNCQYKTEDGKKCAIGLFIPEGHEAQDSTMGVIDLLDMYPELKPLMPSDDFKKLGDFQMAHDEGFNYGAGYLNNSKTVSEEHLKLFLQFVAYDLFA